MSQESEKINEAKRILDGEIKGCHIDIKYAQSMGHQQAEHAYKNMLFSLERVMEILK